MPMVAWLSLLGCQATKGWWERLKRATAWMVNMESQMDVASLRIKQRSGMMSVAPLVHDGE